MKVDIDQNGKLCISPENDLEGYALSKWYDDWESNNVVLCIEVPCPHRSGEIIEKTVNCK